MSAIFDRSGLKWVGVTDVDNDCAGIEVLDAVPIGGVVTGVGDGVTRGFAGVAGEIRVEGDMTVKIGGVNTGAEPL